MIWLSIVLTGLAALMIWKKHNTRAVPWFLLVGGLGMAGIVTSITGPLDWGIAGVALAGPITIWLGYLFYSEVIRKAKPHRIRTNVVAFALGVMLIGLGGPIGGAIQHLTNGVGNGVGNRVANYLNSNGK
jgi:hypothetical protein